MAILKIILGTIILYFLALLQTTALVQFHFLGVVPNIILIVIIAWNILENPKNFSGVFFGFVGGFFLDVFSSGPMGLNILIMTLTAILLKFIFRKYVRIPFAQRV